MSEKLEVQPNLQDRFKAGLELRTSLRGGTSTAAIEAAEELVEAEKATKKAAESKEAAIKKAARPARKKEIQKIYDEIKDKIEAEKKKKPSEAKEKD